MSSWQVVFHPARGCWVGDNFILGGYLFLQRGGYSRADIDAVTCVNVTGNDKVFSRGAADKGRRWSITVAALWSK